MQEQTRTKLTQETLLDKLIPYFTNIWDIEADIKDLLATAKEDEVPDAALVSQIAKARVYNNISKMQEKATKQLETIDKLGM